MAGLSFNVSGVPTGTITRSSPDYANATVTGTAPASTAKTIAGAPYTIPAFTSTMAQRYQKRTRANGTRYTYYYGPTAGAAVAVGIRVMNISPQQEPLHKS